jgi:hypothetical protein
MSDHSVKTVTRAIQAVCPEFAVGGSRALNAHGLTHRATDDIDFFVEETPDHSKQAKITESLKSRGFSARWDKDGSQLLVSAHSGREHVEVEFAHGLLNQGNMAGESTVKDGVAYLSERKSIFDKLESLSKGGGSGSPRPKDLIDAYFIFKKDPTAWSGALSSLEPLSAATLLVGLAGSLGRAASSLTEEDLAKYEIKESVGDMHSVLSHFAEAATGMLDALTKQVQAGPPTKPGRSTANSGGVAARVRDVSRRGVAALRELLGRLKKLKFPRRRAARAAARS